MHRRAPSLTATLMFAFALGACLAASCSLPLSHTCHTSNDCISGVCLEGTCRAEQTNDVGVSDASKIDGADATADRYDAIADQSIDGPADSGAEVSATDARDTSASPDVPPDESAQDVAVTDGAGDASAPPDAPMDGASGDAEAGPIDAGPPPVACPAWADWPMPAPATLAGPSVEPPGNLPNPTSYDTTSPDVVVDNVTHLVWQRVISTDARTYVQAASYCAGLDLGGRQDWRLPSRIELVSLIDWERARLGNIDSVFTDSPSQSVWACTPGPANPLVAWLVDFSNGDVGITAKTMALLTRCVAGAGTSTPPPARFEVGPDGTVTDIKTLLTWQAALAPTVLNWGDGLNYCQGLGPGWRLPTVLELLTLDDETQVFSAVDPSAFTWKDSGYWTLSRFDSNDTFYWDVDFGYGNTHPNATSTLAYVRCVR